MSHHSQSISVGMPVYNGEPYLEDAIRSVLAQTDSDFTLYITDNASTDRSGDICRDYARQDERVIYRCNEVNVGAAENYNRVFRLAEARYFRWFNADDLSEPELHARCLAALEADPDCVMAYGNTLLINEQGETIEAYRDDLDLPEDDAATRFTNFFDRVGLTNAIYGLMRREALARTSLMGDGSFPAADVVLMAELALHGKIRRLEPLLFRRRMHERSISQYRGDYGEETRFWRGRSGAFVMPTWKRHRAFLQALGSAPLSPLERLRLGAHILRRLSWYRGDLLVEARLALAGRTQKHARSAES